jgi:hypothetical protein
MMKISNLAVRIVRFVDDGFPGWVACEFDDIEGRRHTIIDKVPIFTSDDLGSDSAYPVSGSMPCEVLAPWRDQSGRELARISTENPLDDKSEEGLSEFVVAASELKGEAER